VEDGLWELVTAGLVTADGFDNLRALLDPHRRRAQGRDKLRRARYGGGRWTLLDAQPLSTGGMGEGMEAVVESAARQLLRRYGVVFRDLLVRESLAPPWRDLLIRYRRLELRGEIRGGRFVEGFTGDQFALPEAVETLRALKRSGTSGGAQEIRISAVDPLNLLGVILPGPRVPAVPSKTIVLRNGLPVQCHMSSRRVRAKERET
jgi:ATP-dependent Lhr-like helicase